MRKKMTAMATHGSVVGAKKDPRAELKVGGNSNSNANAREVIEGAMQESDR